MRCVLIFPANFTEDAAVAANEIAEVSAGGHKLQTTALYGENSMSTFLRECRMVVVSPYMQRIMEGGGLITFCMQEFKLPA